MTVIFTTNLGFIKPDFDHRNWDVDLNVSIDLIEEAVSGYISIAITGPHTLLIPDGLTGDGRHMIVEFTGTLAADAVITVPAVEKMWIFFNNTNRRLTFDSGSVTVSVPSVTYALIYGDATDMFKVFELNTAVLEPEIPTLSLVLNDKNMQDPFDTIDESLWTQEAHLGGTTFEIIADDGATRKSAYGGNFLRMTGRGGWVYKKLPFNPDMLYKISGRLRQHVDGSSGHTVFVGVRAYAKDKTTVVDKNGGTSESPFDDHMIAVRNLTLDAADGITYFEGYIRGTSATGSQGPKNSIGSPGVIHEDARYVAPIVMVNWDTSDGVCDIDAIELEELPDINQDNGFLAFDAGGRADNPRRAIALSTIGFEQNSETITSNLALVDDPATARGRFIQTIDPGGAEFDVTLPAVLSQPRGYNIYCGGDNFAIHVKSSDGSEIIRLESNEWCTIYASSLAPTAATDWRMAGKSAQVRKFTASGTFIVPQGVSTALSELCGGGGGGGSGKSGSSHGAGGGGGAEHLMVSHTNLTPGDSMTVTVGTGGAGGSFDDNDGDAGVNSTFDAITVNGGQGGGAANSGSGGVGGSKGNGGNATEGGQGGKGGTSGSVDASDGGQGTREDGGSKGGGNAEQAGGGGGGSRGAGAQGGTPIDDDGSNATGEGGGGGGASRGTGDGGNGHEGFVRIRF